MDNKTKVDQIHDLLPKHLNSKTNINWKAIVEALGQSDQATLDLISEVRKQFFIKTASRPYLDRLAANSKIVRPRYIGMDDASFRQYIPILSYQPKQVKLIIDQLLDIFFFKEATTALITSQNFEPFALEDGWELEYRVDDLHDERITFGNDEFTAISMASANEVVAAINRQSKNSYAVAYYDSITKNTYIRLFSTTIGSKGSIRITGGRANIALRFNGFLDAAGNGNNTEWTVSKIGGQVTFQHTAGNSPNINELQVGDIFLSNIPNNEGSFAIEEIDLANSSITFTNLFGTAGTYTQTSENDTKFLRPNKYTAYQRKRHAMVWETSPSEIVVEMPSTPPVVKRSLKGSMHLNGPFSQMTSRDSDTELTVANADLFPNEGTFFIEETNEILTRILTTSENTVVSKLNNSRLISRPTKYSYSSRTVLSTTGDTIAGTQQITNLGSVAGLAVGQNIVMNGVPLYARITSIAGFTVNLSTPVSLTLTGEAVSFLGNTLTGITPDLPAASSLNEFALSSISRAGSTVTATTSSPHTFNTDEYTLISGSSGIFAATTTGDVANNSNVISNLASLSGLTIGQLITGTGIPADTQIIDMGVSSVTISNNATATNTGVLLTFNDNLNGTFKITNTGANTFTYTLAGATGSATTPGSSRVERQGLADSGSKIILNTAVSNAVSRIRGSYLWDGAAPFVLSSDQAKTNDEIQLGRIVRILNTTVNDLPADGGFVIFDYGLENQEGPVRYLYKPTPSTIALDPSYIFKHNHAVNSSIVGINHKGPHILSGNAAEYPPYITDPSEARVILQDLIKSVKSAGIFVNFLVRYPEQIFGIYDVYGVDDT